MINLNGSIDNGRVRVFRNLTGVAAGGGYFDDPTSVDAVPVEINADTNLVLPGNLNPPTGIPDTLLMTIPYSNTGSVNLIPYKILMNRGDTLTFTLSAVGASPQSMVVLSIAYRYQ